MDKENQKPAEVVETPNAISGTENSQQGKEKESADKLEKGFTQEEVNGIVSKRLNEATEKIRREAQLEIQRTLEEERKLAKLSAEEREKELLKKQQEELLSRENNLRLRENRANALEKFSEYGLNSKLVDFVVDLDSEKTNERIEALKDAFNDAVQKAVDAKLSTNVPKDPSKPATPTQENGNQIFKPGF